jgi:RNA polymerase sigma factor (sigma-70 family)
MHLDPTGVNPGERYEEIRRRLIKLFEWRGCRDSDDLADATIDRVANLIGAGREILAKDSFSFFYGVAQNILREYWANKERKKIPLEELSNWEERPTKEQSPAAADSTEIERIHECLDNCSSRLSESDRTLIIDYYIGERSVKIARRKHMADELRITPNALRIRAYRIREELETCVAGCTGSSEEEAQP